MRHFLIPFIFLLCFAHQDKKSDQAEFTGIDDGQKTKTINPELKEDKKKAILARLAGQL